ncbi:TonB-dependent receptor [Bacteroidia bacterium]|nr:TonB-dependent receptor [Bacteroidia bacterium]
MKKKIVIILCVIACFSPVKANNPDTTPDTLSSKYLDEVVVSASTKETNDLKALPTSVTFLPARTIEERKIIGIKDLSTIAPNLFIPDYGSKLSVPVYIRGIGERMTGQSIGLYVDNMPYLDKSIFDFELLDIAQIEILRGPQGTLYGRNAMSGIVQLRTFSPLEQQYRKVSLTTGNYGLFRAKAAVSERLAANLGLSISGYYDGNDGYFTNAFSREKADGLQSGGGRVRLDWAFLPQWTAQLTANYDYVEQGAFPYGEYKDGTVADPNYNYQGNYRRQVVGTSLNVNYQNDRIIFNSATAFHYFDDNMKMDTDNSPAALFRLNQLQRERSATEELTLKSNTKNNYQWSFGLFGFYNELNTSVTTTMDKDGIANILQPAFDKIHENNPRAPQMTVKNAEIPIPGTFKTPAYGGAVFHQSTYNNLFIDGLSVTAGLRLDYEKPRLDYNTNMDMDLDVAVQAGPQMIHIDSALVTTLQGKQSAKFTELLPKIAVKYEINSESYVYASVSNGYKTGGYNIQNFADIVQEAVREKYDRSFHASPVDSLVPYKPEYSWNYEAGYKGEVVQNVLYAEIAGFLTDVRDIQIADFVESGQGRILKNAGKARSLGVDVSLTAHLTHELGLTANYGFTHATFQDYKTLEADYKGNFLPFAPQHTLSLSAAYRKQFQNAWIDRLTLLAQYNSAGRIYWTEANDVYQPFYGLLNLRAGVTKGIVGVNLWANNVLNTHYAAFYFESMGRNLAQSGKPLTFGLDLSLSF